MLHLRARPHRICDRRVPMTSLLIFKWAELLLVKLRMQTHLHPTVVCHLQLALRSTFVVKCDNMLRSGFNFLLLEIISDCIDISGLPFFEQSLLYWLNIFWIGEFWRTIAMCCEMSQKIQLESIESLSEAHCTGLILLWERSQLLRKL